MDIRNPAPELVPVLLVNGLLLNGRDFDFSVRADKGDTLTETTDTLTFISGTSGQEVTIARSQVAIMSKVTRMVPKAAFIPIDPSKPQPVPEPPK